MTMTHVDGTDPYSWPYDGRLDGDHLALVLAGWDHSWAGRVRGGPRAAAMCRALAAAVAAHGGLVVTIAHGAPGLSELEAHHAVTASGIDGFHGGPLDDLLRATGRTHLLVAGHGIEAAVHSTLRSANDRGYECLLVADACSSLTEDLVPASLLTVTMSGGIFGAVGATDPVLAALAPPLAPPLAPTDQELS